MVWKFAYKLVTGTPDIRRNADLEFDRPLTRPQPPRPREVSVALCSAIAKAPRMSVTSAPKEEANLVRAVGVPGLTANIINTTVGAGIFVLPASVALLMGPAAPLAFLICAFVMGLVVASFALAGSRVSVSGGLYGYVETAFGRSMGFLAGALLFVNACLGVSSVGTAFAGFVGTAFPIVANRPGKIALLATVFLFLAAINIRGVKSGVGVVGTVTIAKMIPLLLYVIIGIHSINPDLVAWHGWPSPRKLGESVVLLVFAFSGVEVALTPSGEVKNPAKTVPRSLLGALSLITVLYVAIQVVTQGVLGNDIANFKNAPLAEAGSRFLGNGGGVLILTGAIISSFGFVASDMLGSPRTLFALSQLGVLPAIFSRIHPRFHTPHYAILGYAAITFLLALSSTFEHLVILSSIPLLLLYLLACIAAVTLIRRDVSLAGNPLRFPGAFLVPIGAALAVTWILIEAIKSVWAETSLNEVGLIGLLVVAGALLFIFRRNSLK